MTTTNHTSPSGEDDFVFKNHQRLLFLTADLEDADLRKARNDLLDRMPVMTYSAVCLQIDAILSERSLSLNPLGSSKARPISDVMMDLVDRLGHEWKDVDPRAWSRLLIYAPNGEDAANGAMGEREAFEADYAKVWNAAMKENGWNADHTADDVKDLREGITYGEGRDYLNARWEGWQARAASPQAMATQPAQTERAQYAALSQSTEGK